MSEIKYRHNLQTIIVFLKRSITDISLFKTIFASEKKDEFKRFKHSPL